MPDAYTRISKPVGTPYTNVNVVGREQYDQGNLTYDDASTFYDGTDFNAYTNIPKPTGGTTSLISVGFASGRLIPLTIASIITIGEDPWTKIPKPIN